MKTNITLLLVLIVLAACGIFNLGGTNEDGTQKEVVTGADAVQVITTFADAAMIVWGTPLMREKAPAMIPLLDTNGDGAVTVTEISAKLSTDRESVRSSVDFALQSWASDEIRKKYPFIIPLFDTNEDGRLQLVEIEDKIDLNDPNKVANLIAIGLAFAASR